MWSLSLETLKQLVKYIPTYYGAEWSWVIHALHHIIRTAEKSFVSIPYQNEYCIYTDSDGLENDKHWGELEPACGEQLNLTIKLFTQQYTF